MHHSLPLITTIALGFALALFFGLLAVRFKMPALVGYLMAGIAIGPFTPGIIADVKIARELTELGIMLLMFGVGLHFSITDLMRVRKIAIPGAIVQITAATLIGSGLALSWGWNVGGAFVFGLALSVASTVVLLRALEERGMLSSISGHIAVGWLLVEDLVMIVVLVILPSFSQWLHGGVSEHAEPIWSSLGFTLIKIASFIGLMLVIGRRVVPSLLWFVARSGSHELFTLTVITAAISVAYLAASVFGVSFALGAFFAGMIMRESAFRHRAADESLPLRDAFSVLFFVSVGMLFDPAILIQQPCKVFYVLLVIMLGKSIAAFFLVLLFRYPLQSAFIVSASLAQIGEFSFILAELGILYGLFPIEGRSLILAGALISIALNPLLFHGIKCLEQWLTKHPGIFRLVEYEDDPLAALPMETKKQYLAGQVVLVGYGHVGKRLAMLLMSKGIPYVVVDANRAVVEDVREQGGVAVFGDASDPLVLVQAHINRADMLILTTTETLSVRKIIDCAQTLNSTIEMLVRTHDEEEATLLQQDVHGKIFFAEAEIARNMGDYALARYGVD